MNQYDVYEDTGKHGIYFLFDSKKAKLKIQTDISHLWNVGVAVNDGGEITIIRTPQKEPITCNNPKRKRTKVTTDGSNILFIRTSSGVTVKVIHCGHYLNIYIEVPPNLYKNTAGLCGSFDDDKSNDFTIINQSFSESEFKTHYSFLNVTCINDCNGHGVCNKGSCLCDTGYLGEDCSLLSGTPPSNVQYLEPMFCDRAERPCRSVRLQADNIVTTSDVFCKVTIKHNNGSVYEIIHKGITQGFGIVTCRLPDIEHFTYNISLSNDGKIFKESDPSAPERIIGDSSQIWDECLKQNILKSRADTCVKEGKCYERKTGDVVCSREQHYGPWSQFGQCSKSCDYGIQIRTRICLKPICVGDLVQTNICNIVHCSKPSVITSTLELLNDYSRNNPAELCDSIQLRWKDKGNIISNVFLPGDIKIASGYPEAVSENVVR
ncbi:hypothetical protein LSH36_1520g00006 [Paralvinella palmiformis]|uniref:VWFD domain-containing protein n=1 Tax=Paralvinella palmiformis TaxID=53620 RepID=A0AAD9IS78_9ANNE|nr:hypothetical protein LSH36_1520g00006 [Paralvinella palmiformis]